MPLFAKDSLSKLDFSRMEEHHVLQLIMFEYSVDMEKENINARKALCSIVGCSEGMLNNAICGNAHFSAKQWIKIEKGTHTLVYRWWLESVRNGQ